mgnify:CR=1 FL=1
MADSQSTSSSHSENNQSPNQGTLGRFLGIMIIFGLIYYAIVWRNLDWPVMSKWIVSGGVLTIAILIYVFSLTRSARTEQVIKVMSNAIVVLMLIFGAMVAAILYSPKDQSWLFKIFVILYFSLLPPWLYLQFISTKGKTLWEEFVSNLYRLRVDNFANLPEPPIRSIFYADWLKAHGGENPNDADSRERSMYRKKFESLFGPVVSQDDSPFSIFRGENLWPVAFATLIISVGWVFVVGPETLVGFSILSDNLESIGSPVIPLEAFRFAFLGAYFYVLQMLVRRYFQNDLKTSAYVNSIMRIIIVILLVWIIDMVTQGFMAEEQRYMFAFIIGVFPHIGWQAIQSLVKLPMKSVVPSLQQQYPLSDLDGLNIWYESRLLEEGIEDMQNLVTANLVDVMLNTRIPVERLVDWVDQSMLYLHIGTTQSNGSELSERHILRRYGIRTATDLEDVFDMNHGNGSLSQEEIAKFEYLLNKSTDEPSVLRSVIATLRNEPNYYQVQQWKDFPRLQFSGVDA